MGIEQAWMHGVFFRQHDGARARFIELTAVFWIGEKCDLVRRRMVKCVDLLQLPLAITGDDSAADGSEVIQRERARGR